VTIRALSNTEHIIDSDWSEERQVRELGTPVLRADGNVVTWGAIAGAIRYRLIINEAEEIVRTVTDRSFILSELDSKNFRISIRAEANNAVYSVWSEDFNPTIFQITIDPSNYGDVITRFVASNTTLYEMGIQTPIFYRHTFEGWFTNTELTIPANFDAPITTDLVLFANWIREHHFVEVLAGDQHSFAIDEFGNLWDWGSNGNG